MSFSVLNSTQYRIGEIIISTKSGDIEISKLFQEINIFDSVFMPVMSGNVVIVDAIGLSGKLIFDGSETILFDIKKDNNSPVAEFKKAFRIYKQSDRVNLNMNSEKFTLHFVADELMYSDQQRVNQSYEMLYSDIVKKIIIDYLKVPSNNLKGMFEESVGIKKVVIPNLRPLEAIQWCAKRSIDTNQSPNFLFFQNLLGYNYATLTTLLTKPAILDVKFEPKNLQKKDSLHEISIARSFEVINQNDSIDTTRSGVLAGKFIGFDPITRIIDTKPIAYGDHYNLMKHGNENPNLSVIQNRDKVDNTKEYDSKKTLSVFGAARQFSEYIKKYDPTSLSKEEVIEQFLFQRQALIKNLVNRRLKFVMPGNFQLTSGFNVNAILPSISIKENGSDNIDENISGNYLIVASRQVIKADKHETIIEVASTSTQNPFIPVGGYQQTEELLNY